MRDLVADVDIVHVESRAADFKGAEVCGKRAAAELGWSATTPFADGVARYVEWFNSQLEPPAVVVDPALP